MEARVRKNMVLGILGDFILRYALIKVTNDSPISSEIFFFGASREPSFLGLKKDSC